MLIVFVLSLTTGLLPAKLDELRRSSLHLITPLIHRCTGGWHTCFFQSNQSRKDRRMLLWQHVFTQTHVSSPGHHRVLLPLGAKRAGKAKQAIDIFLLFSVIIRYNPSIIQPLGWAKGHADIGRADRHVQPAVVGELRFPVGEVSEGWEEGGAGDEWETGGYKGSQLL